MTSNTVKEILAGRLEPGATVTIEGWLRTRRDSKAGFSFLQRPRRIVLRRRSRSSPRRRCRTIRTRSCT